MRSWLLLLTIVALPGAGLPSAASAQDRITLAEVIPALEGSPAGTIDLGPAPAPGSARVVLRRDVLAALRRAGRPTDGLAIPPRVRVTREGRVLGASEIAQLVRAPLGEALGACALEELDGPSAASVCTGELTVEIEPLPLVTTGRLAAVALLREGGRATRVAFSARVTCPPPIVAAGARLTLQVRSGPVLARAPGVARRAGRIGEVIPVVNAVSRITVHARVVDATTAEVVP